MKISDVGEKGLVALAKKIFRSGEIVKVGIGDDAAVLDVDGRSVVVTTDMLVSGTHFPPGTTPEQMARKAVVANVSDIAAMGASPLALLFSVALPRNLELSFVKRMMREMDKVAGEYGAYVVGGDLDESDKIIITGIAIGIFRNGKITKRSGARPSDLVVVTGKLGGASAGLKILLEKILKKGFERLVRAQLEPRARVREAEALAKAGLVNSAIDLSDGLASNLWHLSRESGVKLTIERDLVPDDPLVKKFCAAEHLNPDDFVLFGGEDFELALTVRPEKLWRVMKILQKKGCPATVIGRVSKGRGVQIKKNGKTSELPDRGYEHFQ